MADKFLSLLGMARKANRVVLGLDKAVSAIRAETAQAAVYACDLSDKTKKNCGLPRPNIRFGYWIQPIPSHSCLLPSAVRPG